MVKIGGGWKQAHALCIYLLLVEPAAVQTAVSSEEGSVWENIFNTKLKSDCRLMPVMGLEEEKSQPFKTDRERSASITSVKKFEILSVENPTLDTPSIEPSCEEKTSESVLDVSTPNDILLEGLL